MPAEIESLRLGDVGVDIVATIEEDGDVVDISTATNMKMYFRTPEGNVIEKTGEFLTDGTDGKMKYTVEAGFLPIANKRLIGGWAGEGKCTIGSWSGTSTGFQFRVDDVLRKA